MKLGCAILAWVVLVGAATAPAAQGLVPQGGSVRQALDAIHEDLVELRFEQALAGIEALLGSDQLSGEDRAEAWVLRAQGHVAFGDLKAAEQDYREILKLRPGFVPDPTMTPRKAAERFAKVQAAVIGRLELRLIPPDALVTIDDRPVSIGPDGALPMLAGEHVLRASREGFDPGSRRVTIEAGRSAELEFRLRPNARSIVLSTEPDGVDVTLDGTRVGRTDYGPTGEPTVGRGPARLVLENLPLGEHTIELSKPCFMTVRRRDFLDVDLMDAAPKRYDTIRMVPARSSIATVGGPPGAVLSVDGEPLGNLPLEPTELCPGRHDVEVRRGDRRIWSDTREFDEGQVVTVAVETRPNVVILGASEWPAALAALRGEFNEISVRAQPPSGDLSELRHWERLDLPRDADLVLARRRARGEGDPDEWFVHSPILDMAARFEAGRAELGRPRWMIPAWGFATADSGVGGPSRVTRLRPGGVAASAGIATGDRIVSVGGAPVESSRQLRRILRAASWKAPLVVEWTTRDGTRRKAELRGTPSPRLDPGASTPARDALRAAWARAEAEGEGASAQVARANLALLYGAFGLHESAAKSWQQVVWDQATGIGPGTVQYYLGRELESLGREDEAIRAYRAAAKSLNTAFDDEGPLVAPAARDQLADLGVAATGR